MRLPLLLLIVSLSQPASSANRSARSTALTLYVDQQSEGKTLDGSKDAPFDSIESARNHLRKLRATEAENPLPEGDIVICLRGGDYRRMTPFQLNSEDGGSSDRKIIYRRFGEETVTLSGGVTVSAASLEKVTDEAILNRLPLEVRDSVRKLDFRKIGVEFSEFGDFVYWQKGGLTSKTAPRGAIWIDHQKLEPARYPKRNEGPAGDGFVLTGKVQHTGSIPRYSVEKDPVGGVFSYSDNEVATWADHTGVWLYGYMKETYADGLLRVKSVDRKAGTIAVEQPSWYGIGEGGRYTYLNVLEQLTLPGEFYTDAENGVAYLIPPADFSENSTIELSLCTEPLIEIDGADHVVISGINCKLTRNDAIVVKNASHVAIENLNITNIEGNGIRMPTTGERYNAITRVDFENLGGYAFQIGGGNRLTQQFGHSEVSDCRVNNFGLTRAGKSLLRGVGNTVRHCEFSNCDEGAIAISGNEHVIEYNAFTFLNKEGSDAGAIYMGRNPSETGIKILGNYFQDIGNHLDKVTGIQGVYVDDRSGFVEIRGNIFNRVGSGRHAAAFKANGGGHNLFANNIVVDGVAAFIQVHNTTPEEWRKWYEEKMISDRLGAVDFPNSDSPWARRYPVAFAAARDKIQPAPSTNILENNIIIRGKLVDGIVKGRYADPLPTKKNNHLIDFNPGFENPAEGNFQ
ncbi:MAG: right-handed parallel beta-helix repeat-containing protein, partial [Verrucomicrobiales bacterium]|nr:right-handed parallel beta-helix repeat-containing protein [Verrucomicrobiales bacterium]